MSKIISPSDTARAVSDEIAKTVNKICDRDYDGWACDMRDDMAMTRYVFDKLVNGQSFTMRLGQVVEIMSKMGYTLRVVPKSMGGSLWK